MHIRTVCVIRFLCFFSGDWQIDYMTGGPIHLYIGDTADVRVYSMQDGTVCNIPHLIGKIFVIFRRSLIEYENYP